MNQSKLPEQERTEFGLALSAFVHNNRARAESPSEVVGSLVGTAAAEHIYAEQSREDFVRICEHAFDETKDFYARLVEAEHRQ